MNENLNLVEILKDCPKGTKLYSSVFGEVKFDHINTHTNYPIVIRLKDRKGYESITSEGKMFSEYDGECILFPSKEQRDWSKFTAPWYKKEIFDPKTLKPFDRVLVRYEDNDWLCSFFSHHKDVIDSFPIHACVYCIPYNDDTKHLVGTKDEAPEYYRYWEDEL